MMAKLHKMETVDRSYVEKLINFAPSKKQKKQGFAELQVEGTTAIYNILVRNRCAYLADEVGMGKTYIALGVMSLFRYFNPQARTIIIAPKENIQRKWEKELKNFIRNNWIEQDNRIKSIDDAPVWKPVICDSLLDFAHEALLDADREFFLRMTSFSLALKETDGQKKLRDAILPLTPWLNSSYFKIGDWKQFREDFGTAFNTVMPTADLVIVDEGHNLKHGFSDKVSTRNRLMGLILGHQEISCNNPHYALRARNVLILSATPFEDDYAAIYHQLDVLGFADARLKGADDGRSLPVKNLVRNDISEDEKRKIVSRIMVRRVTTKRIAGKNYTKNMYRREWRKGGFSKHDQPMSIQDADDRLIVALIQKKVAEVLQDERFNNHFQIGMLSSFESFLQSVQTTKNSRKNNEPAPNFDDAEQNRLADEDERQGIDSDAIKLIVDSYNEMFDRQLPHPKLDATVDEFDDSFVTGEKSLVFVRRVATVDEMAAKLDHAFDQWLREKMKSALPRLHPEIDDLFKHYQKDRKRRPDEILEDWEEDENQLELEQIAEDRRYEEEEDPGSAETFFAWFFRGEGPKGVLSGAAYQKNRLSSISSVESTFFEEDYIAFLLNRPKDAFSELARHLKVSVDVLKKTLRNDAFNLFKVISRRKEGYPKLQVFQAYQIAGLSLLAKEDSDLEEKARIILEERFPVEFAVTLSAPKGFPDPEGYIGAVTFITELVKHDGLRSRIWPSVHHDEFRKAFREREQRRELLGAMARLGASYIDLYLLAIRLVGSFTLGTESGAEERFQQLVRDFVKLLEAQMNETGFHAFYELASAAEAFNLLLAVNFPDVPSAPLNDIARIYGATLRRQVPVGRMSGGVNKQLVRQFRMPGFPLVLITTDVLQEGEDLHTFCQKVVHYGIAWTPSSIEQRIGRVDRINCLFERRQTSATQAPSPEKLIQVYYPHLADTIEVLQVRRVLKKVERFMQLTTHETIRRFDDDDSKIDIAKEILESLDDLDFQKEPLKSAFPIDYKWLKGKLDGARVKLPDIEGKFRHLASLWEQLIIDYCIEPKKLETDISRDGYSLLSGPELLKRNHEEKANLRQEFQLTLKSQTSGDATLLRCKSPVGDFPLKKNNQDMDKLMKLQTQLRNTRVCITPEHRGMNTVTVEGSILFHAHTTQIDELVSLVQRAVGSAALMRSQLVGDNEYPDMENDG